MPTEEQTDNPEVCQSSNSSKMDGVGRKASLYAKSSLVFSIIAISFVAICCVIFRTVIYNPPLTQVARTALSVSLALIPISFLLGIAGLLHITLKRKTYYGHWMAISGISLSLILLIIIFYNMIQTMSERLW